MIRVCGSATWRYPRVRRFAVGCVVVLALLAAFTAPRLVAQDSPEARLVWDPVSGATGYIVYWGSASRTYGQSENVGNITNWLIPAPAGNDIVYMVVVAYDAEGRFSPPSEEVAYPDSNTAPTAVDDTAVTPEDTASAPIPVLTNDGDVDGDLLEVTRAVPGPGEGSVAINADETLTFTPAQNFNGTATITYTISDGRGRSATARVFVTVSAVNDAPVAVDDAAKVDVNSPTNGIDVLANDTDVDDATLILESVSAPVNGTASVVNGTVVYTPNPDFVGQDTFTYVVKDALGLSDSATVTVTVAVPNAAPVAIDDVLTVTEDTPGTGNVLENDTDGDGGTLTATLVTSPASTQGAVTLASNGQFTFTPAPNFHGSTSFTYKASDGRLESNTATVSITVTEVNDNPVAAEDRVTVAEDSIGNVIKVLANDTDVDDTSLFVEAITQGAHGGVSLGESGLPSYTPEPGFAGEDTFTYTVSDRRGGTAIGTVFVTVTRTANRPPVAVDDQYNGFEDTFLDLEGEFSVLANDTDTDSDALTVEFVSGPAHGELILAPDGSFTYMPALHFNGTDSFTYKVHDGTDYSNVATATIVLKAEPDLPIASPDAVATDENTPVTGNVLTNDTDPDGETLQAVLTTSPPSTAGVVSLAADGAFTFTPAPNFNGTTSFQYIARDVAEWESSPATVTITVRAVNDAPVADDDTYSVDEDATLSVLAPGVLEGDTDAEGAPLTVTLVTGAKNGTLSLNANGSFSYTPNANFTGTDTFTYTASDGTATSNVATVTIAVRDVVDAPVAVDDAYETGEDIALTVVAPGVLANDTDSDSDRTALVAALATGPANGTVTLNADGSFVYTPAANFAGADSFTYTLSDGQGGTDTGTVSITVTGVNDPPTAVDDAITVVEDTFDVPLYVVTANDSTAPDTGETLRVIAVSEPRHGRLDPIGGETGAPKYLVTPNFCGTESLTYTVSDGNGGTATANVVITVTCVEDMPEPVDDTFTVPEDSVGFVLDVLANDINVDSEDTLRVGACGIGSPGEDMHGTVVVAADRSHIIYTPAVNFTGTAMFHCTIEDDVYRGANAPAGNVIVNVTPVQDAPVATNDSYSTSEDTALTIPAPGVLANDIDVDSDSAALTATLAAGPSNGTVVLNPDGSFTYTPNANFSGPDSFTYRATDGTASSDVATVAIGVTPANDAPVAGSDEASIVEDSGPNAIDVLKNDADGDGGDTLTITAVTQGAHGDVVVTGEGTGLTYEPAPNFVGPDTFTYTISDGKDGSASATVSVLVSNVNDPPTAVDDSANVPEDSGPTPIDVLANDTDLDGDTRTITSVSQGANGTVAMAADGTGVTYAPAANFVGSDSFTYTIADGKGAEATATVTITVTSVNDSPVAVDDSHTTDEDTPLTIAAPGVLGNDTDGDRDSLTAVLGSSPANGTLTLNADGSFSYTPNAGFNGSDSFTYRANDGGTNSNAATVSITVTAVNDAPEASDDSYTTDEDVALVVAARGVLENDTDADASTTLTAALAGGPASGTLSLNADGSFTYTPNEGFNGSDSFTYRANDGAIDSNVATVSITVNNVNDAPVANDDAVTVAEDSVSNPVTVLSNDTDADGETLIISAVTQGVNGSIAILGGGGGLTYTPRPNFFGDDTFTYTISDGKGGSDTASVSVTVVNVNDAPVASNDAHTTDEDTVLTVLAPGVLANDTDIDNAAPALTAALVAGPANGTLAFNADGSFAYTPNAGYNGADTFSYRANDGDADSNTATVTITINPVNDAPAAVNDVYATDEDLALTIAAPGVLANDTDADAGTTLTATLVAGPTNGTLTLNGNGSFTYTPNAGHNGSDTFTYRASDGSSESNVATVSITIKAVNDAPVALNDTFAADEDGALNVGAPGVLGNDTDADGDTLTAAVVAPPANGTLTLNGNGSFTYAPAAGFNGTDTFTYRASDGSAESNAATVTITINAVNDAPVAADDAAAVAEDSGASQIDVLANDTDADRDTLAISAVTQGAHGAVVITGGGAGVTYAPNPDFSGSDSFSYTIADGQGGSDSATVTVSVTGVNDAPVAADDSANLVEDSAPMAIDVLANDEDPEADSLRISAVTQGSNGLVVVTGGGTAVTYAPNANFAGTDSFSYTIEDGNGGTDSAVVSVTVADVNDPPVAREDGNGTDEDRPLVVGVPGVLGNDEDHEGGALTAILVEQPTLGTVTLNANGSYTYTPNPNANGVDTFTYKANDGTQDSNVAPVRIRVSAVNDAPVAADDSLSVPEDSGASALDVLANDDDVDEDTLSIATVTQGANGAVVITGGGTGVTYAPNAGFAGEDSFSYSISDGNGGSDTATVRVTVTNVNDAPVANDDTASVAEDSGANDIDVLANDTDADGHTLSITAVTQGAHGEAAITGEGSGVAYAPAPGYVGIDTFSYTIGDGNGGSDTATVSITVTNVNDAPVAANDAYSTDEDQGLNVAAPGVLGNDTDGDGESLTAVVATGPVKGTLVLNSNGSFTYTPHAGVSGADSFTYKANDGTADSDVATVSLTITATNDAPLAANDAATLLEDSSATAISVLANDEDADGDALTVTAVTQGAHGVTANSGSGVSYTPNPNFAGDDSFTYTISDGQGGTASATVNVTITGVNDAPVAGADAFTTAEDTPLTGNVLANDSDLDGDTLTVALEAPAENGEVTLDAEGSFTYTATPNFTGTDTFSYAVSDGHGGSASAVVTITVSAANDVADPGDDAYSTNEDVVLTVGAPGVLANDLDADGNTLTSTVSSGPAHGTLTLNADGSFTYAPNANFHGTDSFTYGASDGFVSSAGATVTITVNPINDAPVAADEAFTTAEDSPVSGSLLANDTDVDGDTLAAALATPAASGAAVVNGDGSFTYTPQANFSGSDSFSYTVTDGNGGSDTATVTIAVTAADDGPLAVDDAAVTAEDSAVAGNVLANDTDPEGDALTAVLETAPGAAQGTLVLAADGSFTFTPAENFNGTASFTYRANDGTTASNVATVSIGVTPVNDAPHAADDSYFGRSGALLIVDAPGIVGNDADVDSSLSAVLVSAPAHGDLQFNANGGFTYMPAAGFTGVDSFTYHAYDGSVASNTATVSILVASDLVVAEVAGENRTVTTDPAGAGATPADPVETAVTSPVDGTITIADMVSAEPPAGYSFLGHQVVITAPVASAANPLVLTFILEGSLVPAGENEQTIVVFRNGVPLAECEQAGTAALPDPCVAARSVVAGDVQLVVRTSQASAWNLGTSNENTLAVANADSYSVNENDLLVIAAPGVLGNDTDADGNTVSATKVSDPANGELALRADGSFTYRPNAGFSGTDSFTYSANDGHGDSNVATVTITVNVVTHAPEATGDAYTTAEDTALTVATPGLLANDVDASGHALTAELVGGAADGTVAVNADGSFTYTPGANFNGTDMFTYRVSDGETSDTGVVTVTVTGVNDAPTINTPGSQQHALGSVVSLQLSGNDVDGDELQFSATGLPAGLTIGVGGLISGTVTTAGTFDVVATVSDGTAEAKASFKWTVQDTLALVNPGPQVNFERDRVQLKIDAVLPARDSESADLVGDDDSLDDDYDDYDGRFRSRPRLRFYAKGLPRGLKIHKRTGIIHGRLDDRSAGIYQVVVWARLGDKKALTAFLWTVRPFNHPPQIREIDNQIDRLGERVELDLRILDRDGQELTVTIEGLPEGLRYDAEEGAILGRISTTNAPGEYEVTITVSDGTTETTASFEWIVRALSGRW